MSPRSRRRHHQPPPVTLEELRTWFAGNLPDDWFAAPAQVRFDREEIIVTGRLAEPKVVDDDDPALAAAARIAAFREDTREHRMAIADRAQTLFQRHVSWAATCGDHERAFTTASIPVMTRLDMDGRAILDTLIDAGVARSRSEALAWCVRLVAENEADWLAKLRDAMSDLAELRDQGPDSRA
ncbi:MAG: hypothetical protein KJN63_03140 [Acidimicrobiia bacterium]|nr:hypothetical protein [Acidimicrobiia bacterium]